MAISYSPWSEKARWALDHHKVIYKETGYVPILGEPGLRKRLPKWRGGPISVPLLITADDSIGDSFAIAQYAEDVGSNSISLFPESNQDAISAWNRRSEVALAAGRALITQKVLNNPKAQRECMPPMPRVLAGALTRPMTYMGALYLRRKYKYNTKEIEHRRVLEEFLENLRDALRGDQPFLLGNEFSYADICTAVVLQCVRPVTDEFLKLGPATRQAWTDLELAEDFSPLLDWRDQTYETHRQRP